MASGYYVVGVEGSIDKGIRHYSRTYKVVTDQTTAGPGQICTVVPDVQYQSWIHGTEIDLWALCKKKSARPLGEGEGGYLWEVVAEYDSEPMELKQGGDNPSGGPSNNAETQPDLRPWQWEIGSVKTTKILTVDANGLDVVNSAGVPFDPPVEVPSYHGQVSVTLYKTIASDSFSMMGAFLGRVNDGTWLGFADQSALVTEYKLQTQFEHGAWYWQKNVTLEINPDGWNPIKVLDAGTVWKESGSKPLQPILDKSGNPVSSPVPLNGAGQPLTASGTLQYLSFNVYPTIDFGALL